MPSSWPACCCWRPRRWPRSSRGARCCGPTRSSRWASSSSRGPHPGKGRRATMLSVSNLTKTYQEGDREVQAVRDVNFGGEPGEFIAIVGPSGSGKTTTLAMLGGLLTPTNGSIHLNGRAITELSPRQLTEYRRLSVGYVFQANNLLPFLTVRENLLVMSWIGARKDEGKPRADQLIEELGLSHRADALATQLSGGERQRVAIGRALMNDP